MWAYDKDTKRIVKANEKHLVDHLLKLKREQSFWKVVEFIVNVWMKSKPDEWDSYLIHLKAVKMDQKQTYVGKKRFRGVSRKDGIERSMLLDMPHWIDMLVRLLYQDEMEFNKKYYREFARRFPIFAIRDKV